MDARHAPGAPVGVLFALTDGEMSHRTIERVIGRLLTDEELRYAFMRAPRRTLAELNEQGWEMSRLEVDALLAIEIGLWPEVAARIDPRLQRCSLKTTEAETWPPR